MLRRACIVFGLMGLGLLGACVGDAVVNPVPDAGGLDANTTADAAKDSSTVTDSSASDGAVDAGPCSNPKVGNTVSASTGATFATGGSPLVAGDYVLTGVGFSCNGGCTIPTPANLVGGLRIKSNGGNAITIERRVEMDQGGPKFAILDRLDGTFNQAGDTMTLTEVCGNSKLGDAGTESWFARFPVGIGDAGPTGQLRVTMPGLVGTTSQGPNASISFTFTRQ